MLGRGHVRQLARPSRHPASPDVPPHPGHGGGVTPLRTPRSYPAAAPHPASAASRRPWGASPYREGDEPDGRSRAGPRSRLG